MKVLLINGSPHAKGNTYIALHEMEKIFAEENIETEIVHIGNQNIRGCIACRACAKSGKCVFDDMVNDSRIKICGMRRPCSGKPRLLCFRQCNAGGISYPFVFQHTI